MKISELSNYQFAQNKKNNANITSKKLPLINAFGQKIIDFTIVMLLRMAIFVISYKLLLKTLPSKSIEIIKSAVTPEEKFALFYKIESMNVMIAQSLIIAFIVGALYYVLMASKCSFGTLGMKISHLEILDKNSKKPTIFRATVWYILTIIYPVCAILTLLRFYKNGIDVTFIILFTIAALFSETPRTIFGITSLVEKISGLQLQKK